MNADGIPALSATDGADDSPPAETDLSTNRPRRRRWHWWVTAMLLILAAFLYVPLSIGLYAYRDETRPADAAIILGAAVYRKVPSPVFRERIRHGIALYTSGTVRKLVFTGGRAQGDDFAESEAARNMAIREGVPAKDILIETSSTTTWLNFRHAKTLMDAAGIRTVLVVSDPMHMRRSMLMARGIGMKAYASPTPTTLYKSLDSKLFFLWHETKHWFTYRYRKITGTLP